ncbi:MAG: Plug and carboxypeptidase regulatory-like domain-containing protein [Gemmatimonadota bacterium]|nr:Plug and carboxypeptidase regulatory-like domain-containing protein [Gemmatimonadota bacterium]
MRHPTAAASMMVVTVLLRTSSAFGFSPAALRPHVRGVVREVLTEQPVPFVEVALALAGSPERPLVTRTDSGGRFELGLPEGGRYSLWTRRIGYDPLMLPEVEFEANDTLTIEIHIAPKPVQSDSVLTTSHSDRPLYLRGFEERRRLGLGTYFDRAEIDARGIARLGDLLREIPGLHLSSLNTRQAPRQTRSSDFRACAPVLFLDGARVTRSTDPQSVLNGFMQGLSGNNLEAVEVYLGRSDSPGEFADPDARCGVIVVWSRKPGARK